MPDCNCTGETLKWKQTVLTAIKPTKNSKQTLGFSFPPKLNAIFAIASWGCQCQWPSRNAIANNRASESLVVNFEQFFCCQHVLRSKKNSGLTVSRDITNQPLQPILGDADTCFICCDSIWFNFENSRENMCFTLLPSASLRVLNWAYGSAPLQCTVE